MLSVKSPILLSLTNTWDILSLCLKQNSGQYCPIIPGIWNPQVLHVVMLIWSYSARTYIHWTLLLQI
ncbi:hypothetical protein EJO31_25260 [Salmonella enterica subsp. enterica serovar Kottbus]|nr:hypothetical protein [Salmonella enterica subsp. enterica serovar Kottbus]